MSNPSSETRAPTPISNPDFEADPWSSTIKRIRRRRMVRRLPWVVLIGIGVSTVAWYFFWPEDGGTRLAQAWARLRPEKSAPVVETTPVEEPEAPAAPREPEMSELDQLLAEAEATLNVSADPALRSKTFDHLVSLLEAAPWEDGSRALDVLARQHLIDSASLKRIDAHLRGLPQPQADHVHRFWSPRLTLLEGEESRIRMARKLFRAMPEIPPEWRPDVVEAIRYHELDRKAIDAVTTEALLADRGLFLMRFEWLAETGQWAEARAMLLLQPLPINVIELADLQQAVREKGREEKSSPRRAANPLLEPKPVQPVRPAPAPAESLVVPAPVAP